MLMREFVEKLNVFLEEEHISLDRLRECRGWIVVEMVNKIAENCYNSEYLMDGFEIGDGFSLQLYGYDVLCVNGFKENGEVEYEIADDCYTDLTIQGVRVLIAAKREYDLVTEDADGEELDIVKKYLNQ